MKSSHAGMLIAWAVTICAAVLVIVSVGTMLYTLDAVGKRRDAQIESCERGNNVRQTLNVIISSHPRYGLKKLALVDCSLVN